MVEFKDLKVERVSYITDYINGKIKADEEMEVNLKLFFGYSPSEIEKEVDSQTLIISPEELFFEFLHNHGAPDYKIQMFYYKISVWQNGNEIGISPIIFFEKLKDPISLTINEKLERVFKAKEGILTKIFKKVKSGPKCNECIDELTGEITKSFCQTCLGTGYKNGYYKPIEVYCQFLLEENREYVTPYGKIIPKTAACVLGYFPRIEEGDLIFDVERQRLFEVLGVRTPIISRYVVYQIAQIKEVEQSSIYDLLIK